ncbi:uncharacterized protein KGF55_001731 [Candida pseudojiufengensis]|uniref:uncharacterized protein n=1 Tax=Candida pseudojiufengensis TaxID=497109 RepID=UPI002225A3CB|nr:uncharacterized protein KGF55_001731 [Candida pseudojiufengensis]KAI5964662.1 hypothetical protein KGF55_001731 [Candida pseudojiufengensis]
MSPADRVNNSDSGTPDNNAYYNYSPQSPLTANSGRIDNNYPINHSNKDFYNDGEHASPKESNPALELLARLQRPQNNESSESRRFSWSSDHSNSGRIEFSGHTLSTNDHQSRQNISLSDRITPNNAHDQRISSGVSVRSSSNHIPSQSNQNSSFSRHPTTATTSRSSKHPTRPKFHNSRKAHSPTPPPPPPLRTDSSDTQQKHVAARSTVTLASATFNNPSTTTPRARSPVPSYKRRSTHEGQEPPYKRKKAFESSAPRKPVDTYRPTQNTTSSSSSLSRPTTSGNQEPTEYKTFDNDFDYVEFERNAKKKEKSYGFRDVNNFLHNNAHYKLKLAYYATQSEKFLKLAHESIVKDHTGEYENNYNNLIKASIKCLLVLIKKYDNNLYPKLKVSTYYKLAKILFEETQSYDLAQTYINKAISISKKEKYTREAFSCEIFLIQIYEKIDLQQAINFISRKIEQYQRDPHNIYGQLFKLLKIKYLFVNESSLAFVQLQRLAKEKDLNPIIKKVSTIYIAGLLIHRGDPSKALDILKDSDIDEAKETKYSVKCYILIIKLLAYMSLNLNRDAKRTCKALQAVYNLNDSKRWAHWLPTGEVKFGIQSTNMSEIKFFVPWLTVREFKILYYLITSVSSMHSKLELSNIGFEKALKYVNKAEKEITNNIDNSKYMTKQSYEQQIIKLKYYKFLIQFYQQWYSFLTNDFKISYIKEFMNLNNKNFTKPEYIIFKNLYSNMYYIIGMYYHSKADIQAAKYFYMKVRNMTKSTDLQQQPQLQSIQDSLIQINSGIGSDLCRPTGKFNELYIYSTVQLVVLLNYEINEMIEHDRLKEIKNNKLIEINGDIRNSMSDELANALDIPNHSDIFRSNFLTKNEIIRITIILIMSILHDFNPPDENYKFYMSRLNEKTHFYFIYFLCTMAYSLMSIGEDKRRIIDRCLKMLPNSNSQEIKTKTNGKILISTSESADSCRISLLEKLRSNYADLGDRKQVEMINLQLERLFNLLKVKYTTLSKNVIYEINNNEVATN